MKIINTILQLKKDLRYATYYEIAKEYCSLIEEGIEHRWDKVKSEYAGTDLDPADARDDLVNLLQQYKYRMLLMVICCLCEFWEQDLGNFLGEIGIDSNNEYSILKSKLNKRFPNINLDNNTKIKEMRNWANAIKHGKGRSLNQLLNNAKLQNEDILKDSFLGEIDCTGKRKMIKQLDFDSNTLTSTTLDPKNKLQEFYDAIIQFWDNVYAELEKEKTP